MSAVGIICIYLLPGCTLAAHQGLAHFEGRSVPSVVICGRSIPKALIYALIIIFGPLLMGSLFVHVLRGGRA